MDSKDKIIYYTGLDYLAEGFEHLERVKSDPKYDEPINLKRPGEIAQDAKAGLSAGLVRSWRLFTWPSVAAYRLAIELPIAGIRKFIKK